VSLSLASFDPDFVAGPETGQKSKGTVVTLEEILAARAAEPQPATPKAITLDPFSGAPRVFVPSKAPKITAKNLVEQAKDRLLELKAELEAAAKLQVEHDALERLVAAAEALPPT
jgi:hypothetical protein